MRHPGHTSDSEWYFNSKKLLENERREPFQAGHDRNRGVEKHPVPEIAVSIVAELVQVRRAERVKVVEGPFEVRSES